jgi:hypothetical protein
MGSGQKAAAAIWQGTAWALESNVGACFKALRAACARTSAHHLRVALMSAQPFHPRCTDCPLLTVHMRAQSCAQISTFHQVRYLEGRVVSSTGQKYIVEKAEEYDGGSRGKVRSRPWWVQTGACMRVYELSVGCKHFVDRQR